MSDEIALTGQADIDEPSAKVKTHLIRLKQIAMLYYAGRTPEEIAEFFKLTLSKVKAWLASPMCQDLLTKFSNSEREMIKENLKSVLPDMCDRLIADIKDPKSPDSYKAIDKVCKIYGLFDSEKQADPMSRYKQLLDELVGKDDKKAAKKDTQPPIDVEFEEVKDQPG